MPKKINFKGDVRVMSRGSCGFSSWSPGHFTFWTAIGRTSRWREHTAKVTTSSKPILSEKEGSWVSTSSSKYTPSDLTSKPTLSFSQLTKPRIGTCYKVCQGQQDGSVGKGACSQAWSSELDPWSQHGRRRQWTLKKTCLPTCTLALWHLPACSRVCSLTITNNK